MREPWPDPQLCDGPTDDHSNPLDTKTVAQEYCAILKICVPLAALLLLTVLPATALPALAATPAAKGAQIEAELRSDLDKLASTLSTLARLINDLAGQTTND